MSWQSLGGILGGGKEGKTIPWDYVCERCGAWSPRKEWDKGGPKGLPASMQLRIHHSTACGGDAHREATKRAEAEAKEFRGSKELLAMGCPATAVALVMGNMDVTAAVLGVNDFCASERILCLLEGGTGAGKTLASVAWLRIMYEAPYRAPGRFLHITDFTGMFGTTDAQRINLQEAKTIRALVLDEVGRETKSEAASNAIQQLIISRVDRGLRTLVTTNMTEEDFLRRYDAGNLLADRLHTRGVTVRCGSVSLRHKRTPDETPGKWVEVGR